MPSKTLTVVLVCPEENLLEAKKMAAKFVDSATDLGARRMTDRDSTADEETWLEPMDDQVG
jgi:hypothetical protein